MSVTIDIDLRENLGEARDQGARPTCLVFATSAAHEAARATPEYLSTEYLFYNGVQRSHRDPRKGLTLTVIREALQHDGHPLEGAWQYLQGTPDAATWKPPTITNAEHRVMHKALLAIAPRTTSEIHDALQQGEPVLLIISLTTAMYTPDDLAIVRARSNDRITTRRHAVLAVGSGHSNEGRYILVRNSWGQHWGYLGHAWLYDPYLAQQLQMTGLIA